MSYVLGLDPSITSFGASDGVQNIRIQTKAGTPMVERVEILVGELARFICEDESQLWFIEGPSFGSAMAGALWDAGYIMARIDLLARRFGAVVYVVPPASLKKWATGKGNTPKAAMALRLYKKWGVEFDDDPGLDKLFAYALHRYGMAYIAGEVEHVAPKPRGQGKDSKQSARAAARTKLNAPTV